MLSMASAELRVHEWGTFTTLHWPSGTGLGWYQDTRGGVSELPGFVHGFGLGGKSAGGPGATARMETPVLYFYPDERQHVDVSASYVDGRITEYYPGTWTQMELIPADEAGALADLLPVDPDRPGNHYYEARAVPEAAIVRGTRGPDKEGNPRPDEYERFLFYRGVGTFDSRLHASMQEGGTIEVAHHSGDYGIDHVWVLQSSTDAIRWTKLDAFAPYDREAEVAPTSVTLGDLPDHGSVEASVTQLVASMVAALTDSGLSASEAAAMVATWDEQWYREPGQRVFSIPPQSLIDSVLPLEIDPKPNELVRVFVHRQEILSPETLESLELALSPETTPERARQLIADEQFGRFVHGAIDAVAEHVARRTKNEYFFRGMAAIQPKPETADQPPAEVAASR